MRRRHTFSEKLAAAAKWEAKLDDWLGKSGYVVRPLGPYQPDREVVLRDESGIITVEYKCDEEAIKTGRLFIETVSNDVSGRLGWAKTTNADWILYFVVPVRVFAFRPETLRAALDRWSGHFPLKKADNGRFNTLGVCVPESVARSAAEYVAELSEGDGLYLEGPNG
jgi:hypothetical protein